MRSTTKNIRAHNPLQLFYFSSYVCSIRQKSKLIERNFFQKKISVKIFSSLLLIHVFDFRNMQKILQSNNKIFGGKKLRAQFTLQGKKRTVQTLYISIFFFNFTNFLSEIKSFFAMDLHFLGFFRGKSE